jgi:alanine racemase
MNQSSYIEISKSSYKQNLEFIRNLIGEDCRFASVVKGNAYGHGIETFVPMAESMGIDYFAVFDHLEAARVKKVCTKAPDILIMGYIDPEAMEWVIQNGIEFFVFDFERLDSAVKLAKKCGKKANIHLELETGMNRTGFKKEFFKDIFKIISRDKDHIQFKGLCTHLAGAESITNHYRVTNQIRTFNKYVSRFHKMGFNPEYIHAACSAGTINYPKARYNLVRIGILQYGFWPSRETLVQFIGKKTDKHDPLTRIITWKTKIMDTKQVRSGEFVGYGTTHLTEYDIMIASVPVGYAHGYSRTLSNTGRVLVNGQRVSVIGLVNMNMMLVDVTSVPETKKGDEVVIIGNQGELSVSVASFSELSNQLNYEMLTRIPVNIPRKLIN